MLQSSLPVLFRDTGFTDRQPERLPAGAGEKVGKGAGEICYSPTSSLSHLPTCLRFGSGGGSCTHLKEFMRLRSVLWSSSPQTAGEECGVRSEGFGDDCRVSTPHSSLRTPHFSKKWWSRRVTLPHEPACRAGALLVCHDPKVNL